MTVGLDYSFPGWVILGRQISAFPSLGFPVWKIQPLLGLTEQDVNAHELGKQKDGVLVQAAACSRVPPAGGFTPLILAFRSCEMGWGIRGDISQ